MTLSATLADYPEFFFAMSKKELNKTGFTIPMAGSPLGSGKFSQLFASISVLTPESLIVTWMPSETANGESVAYSVILSAENSNSPPVEISVPEVGFTLMQKKVVGLIPGTNYDVWVRARTKSPQPTNSDIKSVHTYPQPQPLRVDQIMPRSLKLVWSPIETPIGALHQVSVTENQTDVFKSDWKPCYQRQVYVYSVTDLVPGTQHIVTLSLLYGGNPNTTDQLEGMITRS